MATRRTANLTAVISSIVISIACVAGPSSVYSEELILVSLDSRTGDIKSVEHKSEDGKQVNQKEGFFYPSKGLIRLYSFQYAVMKFLDQKPIPAFCCPVGGGCYLCAEKMVIAVLRYDRQRDEFKVSLNSYTSSGELKELEKTMDIDPSRSAMRPLTRNYHLAVVKPESSAGYEFWVIDESKEMVWR